MGLLQLTVPGMEQPRPPLQAPTYKSEIVRNNGIILLTLNPGMFSSQSLLHAGLGCPSLLDGVVDPASE